MHFWCFPSFLRAQPMLSSLIWLPYSSLEKSTDYESPCFLIIFSLCPLLPVKSEHFPQRPVPEQPKLIQWTSVFWHHPVWQFDAGVSESEYEGNTFLRHITRKLPTYRTAERRYPKMATRSVGAEKTSDHTCSVYMSLRRATFVVNRSRPLGAGPLN